MNALSDGWPTWSIGWVHRAGEKAVAPGFYSSAGTYLLYRTAFIYLGNIIQCAALALSVPTTTLINTIVFY